MRNEFTVIIERDGEWYIAKDAGCVDTYGV